ncbi:MAG TPA: NADH-ubiquinone oxidoreductase-F iron-sulfur binding region domain-containing protein [Gaiellaceae bacterium]
MSAPHGLPRLLASVRDDGRPTSFEEHIRAYGHARDAAGGSELISIVEASGLSGRGGAGFPTGAKLAAVAGQRGRPVVVVNAVEGEPASGKDRALLRATPHLVLDGAVLAADAVGAREVIVGIGRRASREQKALAEAIAARGRSDGRCTLRAVAAPDGFVNGEETALINFLNGGPPKPTFTPPRPFERGVAGAPTLVQNVETLAQIALIARYGARWFRELGTPAEPGTALATVSGAVARPGIHEVELGTPLRRVLAEAGGSTEAASAYLVGGYFGAWLPAAVGEQLDLDRESLAAHGGALGSRVIIAFPSTACAVAEVARVTRYLADESAGQCGPCVNGLGAIATAVERLSRGEADARPQLKRWAEMVRGRGACRHPDGAVRFVSSALTVFEEEIELHLRHGRCGGKQMAVLPAAQRRQVAA